MLPAMRDMTYAGWKACGYQVRKGEVATGREPKYPFQATFTRDQVNEINDMGDFRLVDTGPSED